MDNFDAHKWFKKQYLEEGHTEDKTERDQAIRRFDQLSDDDKLKLAKIQAMMDRERALREDEPEDDMHDDPGDIRIDHDYYTEDLDEIAFGAAGTDKRTGQVVGEIIELIRSTGVDAYEVMEELGQEFGISFEFGRDF
jgi:hypothetical protein